MKSKVERISRDVRHGDKAGSSLDPYLGSHEELGSPQHLVKQSNKVLDPTQDNFGLISDTNERFKKER